MAVSLIGFLICVLVILYAGSRLSFYGDMLADIMGLGKMWMGLILMAAVTSLPELVTSISSLHFVGSPNLAVGNIIGSCAFNILILSIMDVFYPKRPPVTYVAQQGHVLAASFGIMLMCFVIVSILNPGLFPNAAWIGGSSVIFVVLYLVAIRAVYNYERRPREIPLTEEKHEEIKYTKNIVIGRYTLFALLVIAAALFLPYFGDILAEQTGLGEGFFGTLFLAASTSLPEIVVSVVAIRNNSVDMAMGNVLGSNIFNIFILALSDITYTKEPLLDNITPNLVTPALGTIIITSIGIIGIVYKSKRKWMLAIDTFFIAVVYILTMALMYYKMVPS